MFQIFDQFKGLHKETNSKNREIHLKKEVEKKTNNTEVAKPCYGVAWKQKKHDKKEKARVNFLVSKFLNMKN